MNPRNLDFHTVSSHLNKIWNPKSRTDTNTWVGRDEQKSHIPCLASMMQNKCFSPSRPSKPRRISWSHLRTFSEKVFEFWVFWFALCSVWGLKGVFVTIETDVGYGDWRKHTSGGLSDTFQTTGRQSDFRPNHRWVICNYPKKKNHMTTSFFKR